MKRSGRLFGLDREIGFFPCPPPALEDIYMRVPEGDKLPCHTGTGFLTGSGTVKDEGFIFGIFFCPLTYIFGWVFPHCPPDFCLAVPPRDGFPDVDDGDIRIGHHGLELLR